MPSVASKARVHDIRPRLHAERHHAPSIHLHNSALRTACTDDILGDCGLPCQCQHNTAAVRCPDVTPFSALLRIRGGRAEEGCCTQNRRQRHPGAQHIQSLAGRRGVRKLGVVSLRVTSSSNSPYAVQFLLRRHAQVSCGDYRLNITHSPAQVGRVHGFQQFYCTLALTSLHSVRADGAYFAEQDRSVH